MPSLAVRLGTLRLRNPLLSASGTFGHGLEMGGFCAPAGIGGLVSKTVTLEPRGGNPAPRLCETEAGLINSIGLENKGIAQYLEDVLPEVANADCVIITNVGGHHDHEFADVVAMLDERDEVDAIELNLSCPNVDDGKLPLATDPKRAESVVAGARARTQKPLFAKLSPNVTRIADMAMAVENGGADGITAVNTLLGMAVDWRTRRPGVATIQGGYSGPGIKPVALRCAWECARSVSIPVIGCGGIQTVDDVLQYLVVGCRAVQVGTSSFWNPAHLGDLASQLAAALAEQGIDDVNDLIGTLEVTRR
jgi:dihydroorotate dehydrogenase (NAD+) catalytic subunit